MPLREEGREIRLRRKSSFSIRKSKLLGDRFLHELRIFYLLSGFFFSPNEENFYEVVGDLKKRYPHAKIDIVSSDAPKDEFVFRLMDEGKIPLVFYVDAPKRNNRIIVVSDGDIKGIIDVVLKHIKQRKIAVMGRQKKPMFPLELLVDPSFPAISRLAEEGISISILKPSRENNKIVFREEVVSIEDDLFSGFVVPSVKGYYFFGLKEKINGLKRELPTSDKLKEEEKSVERFIRDAVEKAETIATLDIHTLLRAIERAYPYLREGSLELDSLLFLKNKGEMRAYLTKYLPEKELRLYPIAGIPAGRMKRDIESAYIAGSSIYLSVDPESVKKAKMRFYEDKESGLIALFFDTGKLVFGFFGDKRKLEDETPNAEFIEINSDLGGLASEFKNNEHRILRLARRADRVGEFIGKISTIGISTGKEATLYFFEGVVLGAEIIISGEPTEVKEIAEKIGIYIDKMDEGQHIVFGTAHLVSKRNPASLEKARSIIIRGDKLFIITEEALTIKRGSKIKTPPPKNGEGEHILALQNLDKIEGIEPIEKNTNCIRILTDDKREILCVPRISFYGWIVDGFKRALRIAKKIGAKQVEIMEKEADVIFHIKKGKTEVWIVAKI